MPLTVAQVLTLLDTIDGSYRTSDAALRQTKLADLTTQVVATGDLSVILSLAKPVLAVQAQAVPDVGQQSIYGGFFPALNSALAALGLTYTSGGNMVKVVDLDTFASCQNGLSLFNCLIGPNAAYLYWLTITSGQKSPAQLLTSGNVFAPQTDLGTATVGAGGAVTFTDGAAIRTINDVVNGLQGYTPAPGVLVTVTTAVNGTLTVQVTYNGLNAAGGAVTGRHGTLVLDNLAANATAAMTPQAAGDRISDVTGLAATGSPTATTGAFSLASVLERVTS